MYLTMVVCKHEMTSQQQLGVVELRKYVTKDNFNDLFDNFGNSGDDDVIMKSSPKVVDFTFLLV